jgi:hypothetical protein
MLTGLSIQARNKIPTTSIMAPADRRRIKRESTVVFGGGLATPNESFYGAGIATPKREEIDLDSVSDVLEDPFQGTSSFQQHHGLPGEDEGYASLVAEQARRSVSGNSSSAPILCSSL